MTKFPYNRIISYGCSFTSGEELADGLYLNMSDAELSEYINANKIKNSNELFYNFLKLDRNTVEKIRKHGKTLSWPNFIAKHFNVPLLNRACAGASNEQMLYYYMKDKYEGEIKSTDLVLFGLTSPARWHQFTNQGDEIFGVAAHPWSGVDPEFQKSFIDNWFNSYNMSFNYAKTITFISNQSDLNDNNIKLCYAFITPKTYKYSVLDQLSDKRANDFFEMTMNMYPKHNFLFDDICLYDLTSDPKIEGKKFHAFGHPKIQFHEQFANILIEKIEASI